MCRGRRGSNPSYETKGRCAHRRSHGPRRKTRVATRRGSPIVEGDREASVPNHHLAEVTLRDVCRKGS